MKSEWLKKWDKRIKRMTHKDVALMKLATAAFILMAAKLWSPMLSLEWYWYGLVFAVCYAWLVKRAAR